MTKKTKMIVGVAALGVAAYLIYQKMNKKGFAGMVGNRKLMFSGGVMSDRQLMADGGPIFKPTTTRPIFQSPSITG